MKIPFATAQINRVKANNIVVKLEASERILGYGECLPRPYVTGEDISSVMKVMKKYFTPFLIGQKIRDIREAKFVLSQLYGIAKEEKRCFSGSALCALDLAIFDAVGRAHDVPVAELLGGNLNICSGYSIGVPLINGETLNNILSYVKKYEINHVKVKVGSTLEADVERLKTVRQCLGEAVDVRIDANCQWSPREAIERINILEEFNISCVEQPVAADDIAGLAKVRENIKSAVIADESACSYENIQQLIAQDACDIIDIKLSKCGGLYNSLRILKLAEDSGKACMLGYHIGETGVLEAADRAFALIASDLKYLEGSLSSLLLAENIVHQDLAFDKYGQAPALTGAGLGVTVDEAVLNKYTIFREEIV